MFKKYAKGGIRFPEIDFEPQFLPTAHLGALRPCLVDGKPATFHRWVEEDRALLHIHAMVRPEDQEAIVQRFHGEGVAGPEADIGMTRTCFALVEYADGSVGKVKPELIQFLDRKEG
jgi:hypothetical protein